MKVYDKMLYLILLPASKIAGISYIIEFQFLQIGFRLTS